jgi:hypothetical protein
MNTDHTTTQPTHMNPNAPTEDTAPQHPNVEEGLRALQSAVTGMLEMREKQHEAELLSYLTNLKEEARAHAELRRWKSFARDAWNRVRVDRDTAKSGLDWLEHNYNDLLLELQKGSDDDILSLADDDIPF